MMNRLIATALVTGLAVAAPCSAQAPPAAPADTPSIKVGVLNFAYAEWSFDDHLTKGSYARFGMQPTVWSDFIDNLYRYRFQGPTFEDRENYLATSDAGASFHYNLPGDFGDVHAAVFNGETY